MENYSTCDFSLNCSTFSELLRWRAIHQPKRCAYTFWANDEIEISVSYEQVDKLARAIAARLQSLKASGERALLLYPPGLEFIAAFFGCLYAGVIAVPAYPPRRNQKLSRLQAIVKDAQAKFALTTAPLRTNIKDQFIQNPELATLQWLATDTIADDLADDWRNPLLNRANLALLQYTSGSTGSPKGVRVSHGNLLHNSALIHDCFQDTPNSQGVSWLPPYHDMGLIGGILQPLYVGAPTVLMSPISFLQKPLSWLQAISRHQATTSGGPDFAYELCIRKATPEQLARLDLSSWEVAFSGAEPVRAQVLEQFAATFAPCGFRPEAFYPCYGMAEATLMVSGGIRSQPPSICRIEAPALAQNQVVITDEQAESRLVVGCGQTRLDQKIIIVDPTAFTPCCDRQVGEIWVSGPSVAQGYWNRALQTEETFHARLADTDEGPFLRTGDLGFWQNGELFITGRLKDLIIIRGRNHYPQDIEQTVAQCHPALRPAFGAAFAVEIAGQEKLVIAQEVERRYLRKLDANGVISAIRRAISEEHDLQVYAVLLLKTASLPKTSSGKVQRNACRAGFLAGNLDVAVDWSANPRSKAEFQQLQTTVDALLQDLQSKRQPKTFSENLDSHPPKRSAYSPAAKAVNLAQTIQAWLTLKAAEQLDVDPDTLDIRQPLANYGLNSLAAVSISAELQDWLKRPLSPTLLYDYPTIELIAQYLAAAASDSKAFPADLTSDVGGQANAATEAIAIIGLGCRFPNAPNPDAFWQLLRDGVDAIAEVPPSRWNVDAYYQPTPAIAGKMSTRWGGFLGQVEQFDPQFFGISPREAKRMDPQQRLLLEVCWEALENAGHAPAKLAGSQTGVFIGISNNDYSRLQLHQGAEMDAYAGTGNAFSIAANRLSYLFDFRGPSWAVDTACSSSLVAVHQACQSLRQGECQLALAGGVNLILTPHLTVAFSQARMMAADGRCKTFDAKADGYVRGEGCGVIALKRLSQALKDGDAIWAVIKGSAVNQDGLSNGLTAPNGPAQQAVIRQALAKAGVKPAQISYVEAHGAGTALGDPIELNALKAVLMEERSPAQPAWIGSVKTNIGHLEAAAGIAGLIKGVLCLRHREIPPHLHLQQLTPYIDLEHTPLSIPTKRQPLPTDSSNCLMGVSSFGFGGANAHIILQEAPAPAPSLREVERPQHLLTLSAKHEKALRRLAEDYSAWLKAQPAVSLADVCFTANTGRSHFDHRLAVAATSADQLRQQLAVFAAGGESTGGLHHRVNGEPLSQIAFLFTGQGSQYVGMGRQLYETQPTFRHTLDRCDHILRPYLEKPLLTVLYPQPAAAWRQPATEAADAVPHLLDQTAYTQPALFALEYALAELWRSWGIEPAVMMGHSVGEYVAACLAGVFSLEAGLTLIAERGRLMQALPQAGAMVSIKAAAAQVAAALQPYVGKVAIAAINGPQSTVISGELGAVETISAELAAAGVKTKRLSVSHAFHSPLIEPMLADFERAAKAVHYSPPQRPIISNLTGELATEEIATAAYWCRHLRQSVQFAAGMETLYRQGYTAFVEIGPQPILLAMGRQCLPEEIGVWLPSLRSGQPDWRPLLQSLGALYGGGASVDWDGFDRDYARRRLSLPTYPFQRQRYWVDLPASPAAPNVDSDDPANWTPVLTHLHQGQLHALAQTLEKSGKFSPSQRQLLPTLLQVLAEQHQQQLTQQLTTAAIKDCLYELEWRLQARPTLLAPPDFIPTPQEMSDRIAPQLTALIAQPDLEMYAQGLIQLEALSLTYILEAFEQLSWEFSPNQIFTPTEVAEAAAVIEPHQGLLGRLLQILAAAGGLRPVGSAWQVEQMPRRSPAPVQVKSLSQHPMMAAELTLLQRCGSQLAKVLRGECNPLQLLFPDGDLAAAAQLYQGSPGARVMNTMVQQAVAEALRRLPAGRKIRILEIGAGTGGTTADLLPMLAAHQTDYVFTDISSLFTTRAQEKFRDYPFLRAQALDIEQNPSGQGFRPHDYDVIVAANVLHATRDLRQSLHHVQQLLAPGGLLVLLEGTTRQSWLDLTFGLTEGWWRFTDTDLRPDYPLLSVVQWRQLLEQSGFAQVALLPPPAEDGPVSAAVQAAIAQQSVMLAQAAAVESTTQIGHSSNWLILADAQGVGRQLATLLKARGETCTLVFPGPQYEQSSAQTFSLNPTRKEDFLQLLEAMSQANHSPLRRVIHLWSLDAPATETLTPADITAACHNGCAAALHLTQALAQANLAVTPTLWLITQGAISTGANADLLADLLGVAQSPLWGLGKVISLEQPDLWGGMIDLAPGATAIESAADLLAEIEPETGLEIGQTAPEDHVALRAGQRYVARLTRRPLEVDQQFQFRADGSYLITGGLGFLGLRLARWMVEQGARHLVITGRRKLPPRETWSQLATDQDRETPIPAIQALEAMGATITVCQADVCDKTQMMRVFEQIQTTPWPLRGLIHAAGVVSYQELQDMGLNTLEAVLQPKTEGGWILHQLTQALSLDFFVSFSSAGSVWGAKGQGHYDAANHFLDTLAHYRRSIGLPALSLNWGLLAGGGMVTADYQHWLTEIGIEPLQPEQGFAALRYLLGAAAVQTTVAKIDWSKFKAIYELRGRRSLVADFEGASHPSPAPIAAQTADQPPEILQNLAAVAAEERESLLTNYLQSEVAQVLGLESPQALDPQQGFFDMGLDSLMAIDLKQRLERGLATSLPSTLAFEYPKIADLARCLASVVLGPESPPTFPLPDSNPEINGQGQPAINLLEIEQLKESELETSITQELIELEELLKRS